MSGDAKADELEAAREGHLSELVYPAIFRQTESKQPKTKRGRSTRAKILGAAREMFDEKGYAGTRVTDIVGGAEVALGTFYSYFDDKDHVLAALMEPVFEELYVAARAPYLDSTDPEAVVRDAIESYISVYWKYRDLMRTLIEATTVDQRFADVWFEIRSYFLARIVRNIERAQAMGLATPMNPVLEASALGGMIENFCWIWLAMGGERQHGKSLAPATDLEEMVDVLAGLWSAAIFDRSTDR